jgi:hypothetical protein
MSVQQQQRRSGATVSHPERHAPDVDVLHRESVEHAGALPEPAAAKTRRAAA